MTLLFLLLSTIHPAESLIAEDPAVAPVSADSPVASERSDRAHAFSESDIVAAQQFGQTLSIGEWLGPMAPLALSPFFGITLLSGLSLSGSHWISPDNALLSQSSPLHSHAVFWTFLVLTLMTSLPRLTKVSKPFAQAMDQIESWSGITTLLIMRVIVVTTQQEPPEMDGLLSAGMGTMTLDAVLMIAAVVNFIVIRTVRCFFEILIWLTPFPTVDAVFEFCNKSLCAGLMLLYAWSPIAALVVNLGMFGVCLTVFVWIRRREVFYRTILLGLFARVFLKRRRKDYLVVFPSQACLPFPGRTRCLLERTQDGWQITQVRWLLPARTLTVPEETGKPVVACGMITNSLVFPGFPEVRWDFCQQYNHDADNVAAEFGFVISEATVERDHDPRQLKAELA
ncbi:MAG: hypothetical protein KDA96_04375 [Planctomycetaceae bacterium]|nr:hypothetical protein [Planctomycetaceae bacterium]